MSMAYCKVTDELIDTDLTPWDEHAFERHDDPADCCETGTAHSFVVRRSRFTGDSFECDNCGMPAADLREYQESFYE